MFSIRLPMLALFAFALVAAAGIPRLSSSSHYSVYFDDTDPALRAHEQVLAEFNRGETLVVLLDAGDGSFLEPGLWQFLENLADDLRNHPCVNEVIAASELGIGGVVETSSGQLIPDRNALAEHGRVLDLLLSQDLGLAAMVVDLEVPDHRAGTVTDLAVEIREIVEQSLAGLPVTASYTGTVAMSAAYVDVVRSDLRVIMPVLLVSMFVLLGSLLGGVRSVLAILPVGILAIVSAFGIAGWLSAELAAINTFAPVMILSISVAGCVHLVIAYQGLRQAGAGAEEAALEARRQVILPMTIANGTTVLGFLGLLLSPSPPLRIVGYTVATGIAVSWLACLYVLPALMTRLDPQTSRALGMAAGSRRLAGWAIRHRTLVLGAAAATAIVSATLVTRNNISDSVLEYFPALHPFSQASLAAEAHLAGVNAIFYALDTGQPDGLMQATTLLDIEAFADWLRQQPEVLRVSSPLDSGFVRDAIAVDRLEQRIALLRSRGLSDMEQRELSDDRSTILVTVYADRLDSRRMVDFDLRAKNAASTNLPGIKTASGGASLIFAQLGENNIRSMLLALSLGLVVAALVCGTVLGSARVAVAALACNVLPIAGVYGIWAVTDGKISLGAATVMGMILGIVIDDTVYLLSAWWRDRHQAEAAVRAAGEVGPALVATSLVLAIGLSAGLVSDFRPVFSMSALSAGIVLAALAVDLVVLPAMLERSSTHA